MTSKKDRDQNVEEVLDKFQIKSKEKKDPQPYLCIYCDKGFPKRSNARDHLMIHMDVKPYECHICGKQFRQKVHHAYHITHKHQEIELADP